MLGLPTTIVAALALAAGTLVTGGLHEDGLADVADGFGGGSTPEKKLTIMKDSRIGSYGVAALILSFLLRWSALVALGFVAIPVLLLAHAASRALMPALMRLSPPARENGLSAGAGRPVDRSGPGIDAGSDGSLRYDRPWRGADCCGCL